MDFKRMPEEQRERSHCGRLIHIRAYVDHRQVSRRAPGHQAKIGGLPVHAPSSWIESMATKALVPLSDPDLTTGFLASGRQR
jgi:hypothetical protein